MIGSAEGDREFQIRCWKGMRFEVEKSPDLRTWDSLGVVTNETGTLIFRDNLVSRTG